MLKPPSTPTPTVPAKRARPRSRKKTDILKIDLALQRGGAHGAFTWCVLDRLLEEEWIEIAAISGTSAGAMNAVALVGGLMEGGRLGARRGLRRFWTRVAEISPFHHLQASPLAAALGPASTWMAPWLEPFTQAATQWGSQFSPYQLNPLNLNPLRGSLSDTVDFERLQSLRVHLLDGGASLAPLGAASKTDTQWSFLTKLHDLGRQAAAQWLADHGQALGKHSSFDLSTLIAH